MPILSALCLIGATILFAAVGVVKLIDFADSRSSTTSYSYSSKESDDWTNYLNDGQHSHNVYVLGQYP